MALCEPQATTNTVMITIYQGGYVDAEPVEPSGQAKLQREKMYRSTIDLDVQSN